MNGKKEEKRITKEERIEHIPFSGALWSRPGDAKTSDYLIEIKTTKKDFYRLSVNTILKIEQQARRKGRFPMLIIKTHLFKFNLIPTNERITVCPRKSLTITQNHIGEVIHFLSSSLNYKVSCGSVKANILLTKTEE